MESSVAQQRLVEYFVVVTPQPQWVLHRTTVEIKAEGTHAGTKSLGTVTQADSHQEEKKETGSSVENGNIHLPTIRHDYTFQPQITARYPLVDYDDNPLNPMILQFCFPSDDAVVPSRTYQMPHVHHFVLTNERGRKIYGTCLTIFEEYTPEGPWKTQAMTLEEDDGIELSVDTRGKHLYIPKVLCLLSTWPYLTAFREYLAQLYRLATATDIMNSPLERYIVNICCEIPAPPPGAYEVQLSILNSKIRFWAPPAKLPLAYVALHYSILFECLDIPNILSLWKALVLERKILLVSSQHSILTVCAEILCSLLFPMQWSHLYVPLLPRMFSPMLDAPVPFLCGIVRENKLYAEQFIADDVMIVDLDHNSIKLSSSFPPLPPPPAKKWNKLQSILNELVGSVFWRIRGKEDDYFRTRLSPKKVERLRGENVGSPCWTERLANLDHAFNLAYTPDSPNLLNDSMPETEQTKWANVQEAFHQFFVSTLKNYRTFLTPAVGSSRPSFDRDAFLGQRKMAHVPFLAEMLTTQQFDAFLTRRMYSPGEPDLIFFDQSIDAKKNRSKLKLKKISTPFLRSASAHKDLIKFPAIEPDDRNLHRPRPFVYKKWPERFDQSLFSEPRPIPKMITSEFDRQAYLVAKLRPNIVNNDEVENAQQGLGFDKVIMDPSPELASFTVFLYIYSNFVGRDWQRYLQKERNVQHLSFLSRSKIKPGLHARDGDGIEANAIAMPQRYQSFDSRFNVCDTCPGQGVDRLRSTLDYIGKGAEVSYRTLFEPEAPDTTAETWKPPPEENTTIAALNAFEEAKEIADAQLELAFQTLTTLETRGLPPTPEIFLSLMEACGRCGDSQRATLLMEIMKRDGIVADSEVLARFLHAFAQSNTSDNFAKSGFKSDDVDAYSRFLAKQYDDLHELAQHLPDTSLPTVGSEDDNNSQVSNGSGASYPSSPTFFDWFSPKAPSVRKSRRRKSHRKKDTVTDKILPVTEMVSRQIELGENLLDLLYPDLVIDAKCDSCPHCSYILSEDDVVNGWIAYASQNYTTRCPQCQHRFIPQFIVSTTASAFQGSQGLGSPLYCEFLSPWVLRRELQHVIIGNTGIDGMLNPEWRAGTGLSSTLFWNIIVMSRRYKLPFAFLFQGSFHNRMILPLKPSEL